MAAAVQFSDYAAAAWRAIRRETVRTTHALPAVRLFTLRGVSPDRLAASVMPLRPGNPAKGAGILDGRFAFCGDVLDAGPDGNPWTSPAPSRAFAAHLHGFSWLADLLACEDDNAAARGGQLIDMWIAAYGQWNGFSWAPEILSGRVRAWLSAGSILLDGQPARISSLTRQARHLSRTARLAPDDLPVLRAAITIVMAGMVFPGLARSEARGLALLKQEIPRQILADGGHVSRAPEAAADVFIDLTQLERLAEAAGRELPDSVHRAIDRLGPIMRFFRMSDSTLAAFHGGGEGNKRAIEAALSANNTARRTFGFAPHSGYHRVDAGGATILMDSAAGPAGPASAQAHASALAFEFSAPGGRIIVNCGWSPDQPPSWRHAVRATAAHSTLTLEETSSSRFLAPGWRRQLLGPRFSEVPAHVVARRNEEEIGVWLEGSHDGYRDAFGLSHRRRVFLAADGGDLRGEDALFRPAEDGPPEDPETLHPFAIRFHLHPGVRASLSRDAMSALLVLPSGDGWRFRTDGGPVRIERSVYLAAGAPPKRTAQLVIQGEAEPYGAGERPPNRVRWAFQRLGRVGSATGKGE